MSEQQKITLAKHAGFCFGVKCAANAVENAISRFNGKIYTLGRIIHNDIYCASLADRGVSVIGEEDIPKVAESATPNIPVKIFIRAHGVPIETERLLKKYADADPNFTFEDCTCPHVRSLQKRVEEASLSSNVLFLMGKKDHPEVLGVVSRFPGKTFVYSSAREFLELHRNSTCTNRYLSDLCDSEKNEYFRLDDFHKISDGECVFAVQTTENAAEWKKTQKFIKLLYTKSKIFDTICSITDSRQLEAEELAQKCDLMIVVGSRGSSNTMRLYDICRSKCPKTYLVDTAEELKNNTNIFYTCKHAGIVAGASAPGNIIEEVYKTMSEILEIAKTTESFEDMLEASLKTLNTGDVITGKITAITSGEIQLDLGANVTGRISADQISDDPAADLTKLFSIGDEVEAFVIKVSDIEGFATLSKKRVDSDKNRAKIIDAKNNGDILEGKVVESVKGGIIVSALSVRIFVPASQTGVAKGEELSALVGTNVKLRVIEIKDGKRIIGSIKSVLREERKALEAKFWEEIEEGKTYTGTVKSMTSYGAFVDLGGVDGMVHVTELSWKRIKNPAEVISIGDTITVFVKSFDKESKRISLGYRTEETNPWNIFTSNYAVGDNVKVTIVNLMPFGAFARIIDGVDGLIHISQISTERINLPSSVLSIGQEVEARITEIDTEKRNISLSMRVLIEEAQASEEIVESSEEAAEATEEAVEATEEAVEAE